MITLEEVLSPENMQTACRRVIANKGAPGVDGMTVNEVRAHFENTEQASARTSARGDTFPPWSNASIFPNRTEAHVCWASRRCRTGSSNRP